MTQVVANSGKFSIHPPQRCGYLQWEEEQETGLYVFWCIVTDVCKSLHTAHL